MSNLVKTYHLCPTFDIRPPPEGPVSLGSIVASKFKLKSPLNRLDKAPIPGEFLIETSERTSTRHTMKRSKHSTFGLFSTIAQIAGLGAEASVKTNRNTNDCYEFDKELTTSFEPTDDFLRVATASSGVQNYLKHVKLKTPVFMVTGLVTVEGARLASLESSGRGGTAGLGANLTATGAPVDVGFKAATASDVEASHQFGGSTPFIFCVRLKKIWWDKGGELHEADDEKGAFLGVDEQASGEGADVAKADMHADETTVDDFEQAEIATLVDVEGDREWRCMYTPA